MKNINKMTELEILALSDKQVENLVKVEKMEQGVKLLEKPIEPEYEEVPEKDIIFYYIDPLDAFVFKTKKEAEDLHLALKEKTKTSLYKKYNGRPLQQKSLEDYYKSSYDFEIKSCQYFSPEVAEIGKSIEERNNTLKNRFKEATEEYEEYAKEVESIVSSVWTKVIEVREKYENLRILRNKLSEYKQLADNQKDALTFFLKAYSVTDEELQLIQKGDLGDKK